MKKIKLKNLIKEYTDYSTKYVNRNNLRRFIEYLDLKYIDYDFDGAHDEISFDETELDYRGQDLIKKIGLKEI